MDENNPFLNAYKKKLDEQPAGGAQTDGRAPQSVDTSSLQHMRYEEKPTFVAPRSVNGLTEPTNPTHSKTKPMIIGGVILVAIVILLLWFFNRGSEVINLAGYTLNDAQIWASDNNVNLQVTEEYNDTLDAGKIISQDLKPGTRIKKGGFLKIKVSLGHDLNVTLPLPGLLSMTKTQVEAWAAENYMTKVRITTEYHQQIAAGKVIRFEINDDTVVDLVKRSTPIYVIVSKGPEPQTTAKVTIPNFKEMSIVQSQQFAKEKGLVLKIVEQYDDLTPSGTIIDQGVAAEEAVDAGSEVTLIVSKGKMILIPDFSGYSRQKATAVAAELGIIVAAVDRYSSRTTGLLLSQSLAVGSVYTPGDVLELVYSMGNKIILSSFVGQTRAAIETWVKELNEQGANIHISVTQTQNNAPRDTILYQDKTNTVIGPGTTVRITVSLGKMVFMPDLVAPSGSVYGQIMTREKAAAACETIGLVPVFIAESSSGRLPGEIWYQSLLPGKDVFTGTTVTLKYNPVNVTIAVPDFAGKTREQIIAEGYLAKLDLTFQTADAPVAGFANKVYNQSIRAGVVVAYGTPVILTISPEAPPEETEPTPTPTIATTATTATTST